MGMTEVIPLFKSHYSIGRSILTLNSLGGSDEKGPDSIIDICSEAKMKSFHLVDDSMTGVLEGYTNSLEAGIDLRFGLRINLCNDIKSKDKEYNLKEFKVIIFCKNKSGYERLLRIY